jgi:hypothetical protein
MPTVRFRFRREASVELRSGGNIGGDAIEELLLHSGHVRSPAAAFISIVGRSLRACISGPSPGCPNRNRSPARTVTKRGTVRTAIGTWGGGERARLQERGVNFDFQYVSDSLWNLESR